MRKIKLIIEYDGSRYHGWQYQINAISIQEVLSEAIGKITGEDIKPDGAGRTDAGVHALGQVASFTTNSGIPAEKFASALNAVLPQDISVRSSEAAEDGFHARFSARGKHYRYIVLNRRQRAALWTSRAWHVPDRLDFEAMQEAAGYFLGCHSFKAFCAAGYGTSTFERSIFLSRWQRDGDLLIFDTKGDGFLYNMVRIMVGTMTDIGRGRFKPEIIRRAIESGQRGSIGITAPPWGLYLMEVYYGREA